MTLYVIEEKYIVERIKEVMLELYKENKLDGNKQRDMAQKLETVLNKIVEINKSEI